MSGVLLKLKLFKKSSSGALRWREVMEIRKITRAPPHKTVFDNAITLKRATRLKNQKRRTKLKKENMHFVILSGCALNIRILCCCLRLPVFNFISVQLHKSLIVVHSAAHFSVHQLFRYGVFFFFMHTWHGRWRLIKGVCKRAPIQGVRPIYTGADSCFKAAHFFMLI